MRSKVLDSFRGLAVILVLFRHYPRVNALERIGWIGVDLFFVLSGFLVSGLLFSEYKKTGRITPWTFLIRRGFKIYPLFYTFLGVTIIAHYALKFIGGEHEISLEQLPSELFFVQNYFKGIWNHTWSLAVEEHFYILLAFVISMLVKFNVVENRKLVIRGVLLILIGVLMLRFATWHVLSDYSYRTHFFPTHLRLDSLLFGVFISYIYHFEQEYFVRIGTRYTKLILALIVIILGLPFFYLIDSYFIGTIGLTLLYLAFGALLWISITYEKHILQKVWLMPVIRLLSFVGFYSYSIYLFHVMVGAFLMPIVVKFLPFTVHNKILFTTYSILSVLLGVITSKLIEIPFLKFREKHFKAA